MRRWQGEKEKEDAALRRASLPPTFRRFTTYRFGSTEFEGLGKLNDKHRSKAFHSLKVLSAANLLMKPYGSLVMKSL